MLQVIRNCSLTHKKMFSNLFSFHTTSQHTNNHMVNRKLVMHTKRKIAITDLLNEKNVFCL